MVICCPARRPAVPIVPGTGAGSKLRPSTRGIVGVLAAPQALTLYTEPAVYLYLEHLQN
ncbi:MULTISPECIES: hypothetical protein [unclassified Bradyrhizobium]|uniref:hypothetical protein n=1 Tax=unclassified Bradyrhizobium TaxID=2631580 RepID=UPI002916045E|nr:MULTISPECIES: hypothetical protein [unclassified Bradyrhizobium]